VIGPTTRQAAETAGVAVHVVSPTPSVAALVGALAAHRKGMGIAASPAPRRA
jgi:uroporphyrinogen-III synthase